MSASKSVSPIAMRLAGPWPGCQGRITVGTAQTGWPRVSSANTAARLPTVPRTTWLEMTMTAPFSLSDMPVSPSCPRE